MYLYPALDLRGGRVARSAADVDPLAVMLAWRAVGVTWVHVVDLDQAEGVGDNAPLVRRLLGGGTGLQVQLGGGLAGPAVTGALAAGAARVIVGSGGLDGLAELLLRHGPERVGYALDVRAGAAWTPNGVRVGDPAALFDRAVAAGVRTVVIRNLARDGSLAGMSVDLLAPFRRDGVDLVLAGGARSTDDLRAARRAGAAGVIVGRAVLDGRLDIAEALACCG